MELVCFNTYNYFSESNVMTWKNAREAQAHHLQMFLYLQLRRSTSRGINN